MIRKSEHHCKCEFPPEGLLVFIIRAIKCFKSEKFLGNSGDHQSRLLIDIFEKNVQKFKLMKLNLRKQYNHELFKHCLGKCTCTK